MVHSESSQCTHVIGNVRTLWFKVVVTLKYFMHDLGVASVPSPLARTSVCAPYEYKRVNFSFELQVNNSTLVTPRDDRLSRYYEGPTDGQ